MSIIDSAERLRRVVEEERKVLTEKARLLAEGIVVESYTAYLGLRVRPTIKQLWEAAPKQAKRIAKQALEAAILAFYLGGQVDLGTPLCNAPMVMNLNIVEAKAEAKAKVEVDLRPLVKLLEQLIDELVLIRNLARFSRDSNARTIYQRAEAILKRLDKEKEKLERIAYN